MSLVSDRVTFRVEFRSQMIIIVVVIHPRVLSLSPIPLFVP